MKRRIRTYEGPELDVTFDPGLCIHSERCVRGLGAVFDPGRRPWIDASAASGEAIASAVATCPTGALGVVRRDGAAERPDAIPAIEPVADGPLHVRGDLRVDLPGSTETHRGTRLALCRCGRSQNKPFCDNAHLESGFRDPGTVPAPATASEHDLRDAEIRITPLEDGPLRVVGVVRAGSGTFANPTLCRCGHSSNRPFCDGSHRTTGFRARGGGSIGGGSIGGSPLGVRPPEAGPSGAGPPAAGPEGG